jgi:SAM-dependent methyltransferase
MTDSGAIDLEVLLSRFAPAEKEIQAESFGGVASEYERFRPGPPASALDWLLPTHLHRVVDLGAGTGTVTKLLLDRADDIVAVEPDDRMRSVLARDVPGVEAVMGRGESMPIPDHSVDAVLAASSWHWMEPLQTLHEVGRVLVPGGTLGALWTFPDPEGPFVIQAQTLLAGSPNAPREEFSHLIMGDEYRLPTILEIPLGVPFSPPEREIFTWDVALDADELIGLLGTWPWIITLPEEARQRVFAEARRLLKELLGVEGPVTVDVAFRSDAWRTHRDDA